MTGDADVGGILSQALVLAQKGQSAEALNLCHRALAINSSSFRAWELAGFSLTNLGRFAEALAAYHEAVRIVPESAEAWRGAGSALFRMNRFSEADAAYQQAIKLDPTRVSAVIIHGHVLSRLKRYGEAIACFDKALAHDPNNFAVRSIRRHCRAAICDWAEWDEDLSEVVRRVALGEFAITPLDILALCENADIHRKCAQITAGRDVVQIQNYPQRSVQGRIRIGYLSADFREHPVSYLIADVFKKHDRSKFEIIAFSTSLPNNDEVKNRLRKEFDEFYDVENLNLTELGSFIAAQNIEIIVDLTGHTDMGRTAALVGRPAPIQVNFLGFPGTLGYDCIDYIIGDPIVTPSGSDAFYAEKIVRLPHSYQPNSRRPAPIATSRSAHGLPEDAVVFCCFNAPYKITPLVFSKWMRILDASPGSLLWLLAPHEGVEANLREEAARHNVEPTRLVFATLAPRADHLGRLALADIFLDTAPYGAHTTASDALWAGLPVITHAGATFASRVAASLVTAAGFPELDRSKGDDYEAYAVALAKDPTRRSALKDHLLANRETSPLFNVEAFTSSLEQAFMEMSARWRRGAQPESFDVCA